MNGKEQAPPEAGAPVSSYDEVPYESRAVQQTHPALMAAMGMLFGLSPPPVSRCRVLELGCARGDNLLSMATTLPEGTFLGIDASAGQIAEGRRRAAVLSLANVTFEAMDLLDLPADLPPFDYVLCHGVFSWVVPEAADRILEVCSRHLVPGGIAYVSYNTYPGWHVKAMVREMMQFHLRRHGAEGPAAQVREARQLIRSLAESAFETDAFYRPMLRQMAEHLENVPDYYVFHEYLEEVNRPLAVHEFAERAAERGLQLIGPARFRASDGPLSPAAAEMLSRAADRVEREQYKDFLWNGMFRESLLCHADIAVKDRPSAEAIPSLFVTPRARPSRPAPDLTPGVAEEFLSRGGARLTTNRPLMKAAIAILSELAPCPVSFEALWSAVAERVPLPEGEVARGELAEELLHAQLSNFVELRAQPPLFRARPGEQPIASPLARLQAREGEAISNLEHSAVKVNALDRFLLAALDGTRDRAKLAALLLDALAAGSLELLDADGNAVHDPAAIEQSAREAVEVSLERLAAWALLAA